MKGFLLLHSDYFNYPAYPAAEGDPAILLTNLILYTLLTYSPPFSLVSLAHW
jgi:hypothetical protein